MRHICRLECCHTKRWIIIKIQSAFNILCIFFPCGLYTMACLEKVLISPWLVTLLHICGVTQLRNRRSPETPCKRRYHRIKWRVFECFVMFHNVLREFHNVLLVVRYVLWCFTMYHNVLQVFHDVLRCLVSCATIGQSPITPQESAMTPQESAITPRKWANA